MLIKILKTKTLTKIVNLNFLTVFFVGINLAFITIFIAKYQGIYLSIQFISVITFFYSFSALLVNLPYIKKLSFIHSLYMFFISTLVYILICIYFFITNNIETTLILAIGNSIFETFISKLYMINLPLLIQPYKWLMKKIYLLENNYFTIGNLVGAFIAMFVNNLHIFMSLLLMFLIIKNIFTFLTIKTLKKLEV